MMQIIKALYNTHLKAQYDTNHKSLIQYSSRSSVRYKICSIQITEDLKVLFNTNPTTGLAQYKSYTFCMIQVLILGY